MRACFSDYSHTGAYFITVCVKDRRSILSCVVGTGVPDRPSIKLMYCGKIVDKYLNQLNEFYENISVDEYVIMPNHIHLIVSVVNDGPSRTPVPTLNSTVSKFISTLKRFVNKEIGENIFQRSFYDRIIRNRDEYMEICNYIRLNPENWENDELYN